MYNSIIQIYHLVMFAYVYIKMLCFIYLETWFQIVDDNQRKKHVNRIYYNIWEQLDNIFNNRIKINKNIESKNKVTLINVNHVHNLDSLMLWILFYKNGIQPNAITSISTYNNISSFDKKILELYESININAKNLQSEFENKINKYQSRNYNKYMISYFEGITLHHSKQRPYYEYTNKPKYLAFELMSNKFKNKEFYDVDLVYTYKNKLMNAKDPYFIWKLMHPSCNIYVNIKTCRFPEKNEKEFLDDLYKRKNENIKQILRKLV